MTDIPEKNSNLGINQRTFEITPSKAISEFPSPYLPTTIATPVIPSEEYYYKKITGGVSLLNKISTTQSVILPSLITCELLEAENLGQNFIVSNPNIKTYPEDWFVRIKVRVINPTDTAHTLDLDLTDGIKYLFLYEYNLDGTTKYPEQIAANTTNEIELVLKVSKSVNKIYLLPRGYSSNQPLTIIPISF